MQAIVKTLSNLGERTGIMTLLRRTLATSHALILALHRVLPDDENSLCYNSHLVLSESVFKSMLEWLQHDYQVVPLRDLLARPAGTNGHPKVAITFDDGWEDNYRVAFPHLVSFGMPATIFGCTGLIDSDQLLPEERFARLWARCASDSMLEPLLVDLCHWGMGNRKNQHFSPRLQDWSNELKQMPLSSRLLLLDHLESRYQIPRVHTRRFLTWEQVHIMTRTGLITMESHTSRHAALSSENDRDIRQELSDSRAAIWKYTGTTPEILAYPNGMHNRHVQSIVHSMGFRAALTTCPGFVTLQSNPMAIPRIAVDNTTVSDANVRLSRNQASMYFLSSWLRSAAAF